MSKTKQIKTVSLGREITIEDLVAVARYKATVSFDDAYVQRVNQCRRLVEKFSEEERVMYGITTGLGENWNKFISKEDREIVQRNNVRSHATSVGEPLKPEAVRAMMFVMLQHLGLGHSGVSLETLSALRDILNNDIIPYTPQNGSVGYLSLEGHIGLVLIGEGRAFYKGELLPGGEALSRAGIAPVTLRSKEGLALVSGTTSVTALGALGLYDAIVVAQTCDIAGSMSLEVLKGTLMAMDGRIMAVRPHKHQTGTAKNINSILQDSRIVEHYKEHRVQDALSLRCMPQLHGAAKKLLADSLETITIELNSSVDNPLIFAQDDDGVALMGCNADGAYVGTAADTAVIAISNLAKMSERRLDRMVNPHVSELPAFLNMNPGLNNGLMIPQYSAAGIVGQLRLMSHPATIDNFVTCANQEDYVSMGYNAARQLYQAADLFKYVVAIELLNAAQAQEFYEGLEPSTATKSVHDLIRAEVPQVEVDCELYPFIEYIANLIKEEEIIRVVEEKTGRLEF